MDCVMISNKMDSFEMEFFSGLENLTRFHLSIILHFIPIQTVKLCVWFKQSQVIFWRCFPWLQKVTITYCSIIMTLAQLFISILVHSQITQVHGNQITLIWLLQGPHKSLLTLILHIMFKQRYLFMEWDYDISVMITRIKWTSNSSFEYFQPCHTSEEFISLCDLIEHNHHSCMYHFIQRHGPQLQFISFPSTWHIFKSEESQQPLSSSFLYSQSHSFIIMVLLIWTWSPTELQRYQVVYLTTTLISTPFTPFLIHFSSFLPHHHIWL